MGGSDRGQGCCLHHFRIPTGMRIIQDSWKKPDKSDARNMVKALWVYLVSGEFGIPSVAKPSGLTRELRGSCSASMSRLTGRSAC